MIGQRMHKGDVYCQCATCRIYSAIKDENPEMLRCALRDGGDLHDNNDEPIRLAAMDGTPEIIEILVDYNADVNAKSSEAPLSAAFWQLYDNVKVLLEKGGNVRARNYAMLDMALKFQRFDLLAIVLPYHDISEDIPILRKKLSDYAKNWPKKTQLVVATAIARQILSIHAVAIDAKPVPQF